MTNIFQPFTRFTESLPLNLGVGELVDPVRSQGLNLDSSGRIYAVLNGEINHYHVGLPFNLHGRLVGGSGSVSYWDQGVPFTATGAVCLDELGVDYYDQGVPFAVDGEIVNSEDPSYPPWLPGDPNEYYHDFTTKTLGGFTHTRASDATAPDESGIIQLYEVDEPAWYKDQGIQIEGARTNYLKDSNDLTIANWGDSNGTSSLVTLSNPVDGQTQVTAITNDVGNGSSTRVQQTIIRCPARKFIVKAGVTQYLWVGATTGTDIYVFDLIGGTFEASGEAITAGAKIGDIGGGWWEIETGIGAINDWVQIGPSAGVDKASNLSDSVYIAVAQAEDADFSSSFIYTEGAVVERANVICNAPLTDLGNSPASLANNFSFQIKLTLTDLLSTLDGGSTLIELSNVGGTSFVQAFKTAASSVWVNVHRGGVSTFVQAAVTDTNLLDIRFRQSSSQGSSLWINGAPKVEDPASTAALDTLTLVGLGSRALYGNSQIFGNCSSIRINPAALTDEQIEAWT